ncbi:MAG: glycoside hydrolase family 127 protein [Acetatifactor sp.]|nr:glycoside hydrolase family 127 protein [Acetatifactor sp.]
MNSQEFSNPLDLKQIHVTDAFWHREQELVRTEVIPYQWEALNDRVEGAAPSYCMRNFKAAGRMMREKKDKGAAYVAPAYTFRGFEALPEDPAHPDEDKFYGFVFQDTDFSKWIEAVGYSLLQHPDPVLEQTADEAIDIVCAAQLENGYLDTYYIINGMDRAFTNLRDHHELYCLGHLVEGAVAYYQATGKDKLLKAARGFADYCCAYFGPAQGQCKGYPGHEIAEMALVRLYQVTGEEKYLELSRFFLDQRGTEPYYFDEEEKERAAYDGQPYRKTTNSSYHQAHLPVREQSEAMGHAVRAVYLYSGMADVARLCKDEAMEAACDMLWDNVTREKMYVTGGIGATHMGEAFSFVYDLPNDTAYSETCAAIGLVFWARRMLQLKPRRKYGDVMELALYNTVLAGMALDGKSFFYVNPLEVLPEACHKDSRKAHVKSVRQKWFGCACCPPNIARMVSSVASYAYTETEDTLWMHLYMGSVLSKKVGDKVLDLKVESDMPWEGRVKVQLCGDQVPCRLAFRIPGWSSGVKVSYRCGGSTGQVTVDEEGLSVRENPGEGRPSDGAAQAAYREGYLYMDGVWQDGDEVLLEMDMPVRLLEADARVREDIGKVAVTRGPIVYCLEEADNGKELHLFRVNLQVSDIVTEVTEELGHPMTVLKVPGKRLIPVENAQLYQTVRQPREQDVILRMVPYYAWNNRGEGEMSVWIRR